MFFLFNSELSREKSVKRTNYKLICNFEYFLFKNHIFKLIQRKSLPILLEKY